MPIDRAELLRLIEEDPEVRAAAAKAAKATADAPAPVFTGPAWLADRAHGPHTAKRFSAG